MSTPVLTLLTDYGLHDEFVGVCHGVIAGICPGAQIIDVTHGIAPQDVLGGALRLAAALPYLPVGVHVAIVDPGVGGERKAIALRCQDGRILVGPDNGLLWPASQRAGGVVQALDISESPARLYPVSATFHGRDVFCPVAAHLAAGSPPAELGEPLDPEDLIALHLPRPEVENGQLRATVLLVDRFGNLQLNCRAEDMELDPGSELDIASARARYGRTFTDAPPGELLLYEDSTGFLALAVNQGSAAEQLQLGPGDAILLGPAPPPRDPHR